MERVQELDICLISLALRGSTSVLLILICSISIAILYLLPNNLLQIIAMSGIQRREVYCSEKKAAYLRTVPFGKVVFEVTLSPKSKVMLARWSCPFMTPPLSLKISCSANIIRGIILFGSNLKSHLHYEPMRWADCNEQTW